MAKPYHKDKADDDQPHHQGRELDNVQDPSPGFACSKAEQKGAHQASNEDEGCTKPGKIVGIAERAHHLLGHGLQGTDVAHGSA